MSRKGENIRKRKDGRWEARYRKGRGPDGRIRYGYVYAARYTDAKRKQQEALLQLQAAEQQVEAALTGILFRDYIPIWRDTVRSSIKYSSLCFYSTLLERHLCPYFGSQYLDCIDSGLVQRFINQKTAEHYSIAYIHSMITLLQSILRIAAQQFYRQLPNRAGRLCMQTPARKKPVLQTFSMTQWSILTAYLSQKEEPFCLGLLLCMHTGIRIGELSGLKWEDFDAEAGLIRIRRTVSRVRNLREVAAADSIEMTSGSIADASPRTRIQIGPPKTASSIRDIPLPAFLHETLLARSLQSAPESFLLTGNACCMEPRTIQKRYRKILEICQLPRLNFHALRHGFATLSIQKGVDYRSLSEILGHASVSTTLNIYVHSDLERKRQCMELLWS